MTRCLLALLKTTFHRAELKQPAKGRAKPAAALKVCGANGPVKRRRLHRTLILTFSPAYSLMGKQTLRSVLLNLGL